MPPNDSKRDFVMALLLLGIGKFFRLVRKARHNDAGRGCEKGGYARCCREKSDDIGTDTARVGVESLFNAQDAARGWCRRFFFHAMVLGVLVPGMYRVSNQYTVLGSFPL